MKVAERRGLLLLGPAQATGASESLGAHHMAAILRLLDKIMFAGGIFKILLQSGLPFELSGQ